MAAHGHSPGLASVPPTIRVRSLTPHSALAVGWIQGDRMSLGKSCPECGPTHFLSNFTHKMFLVGTKVNKCPMFENTPILVTLADFNSNQIVF
jgi:hypothetical protein